MKKATLFATLVAAILLGGCDSLLDAGDDYNDITCITENIDFVAISAICTHYPAGSREYTDRENFSIELLGKEKGSTRDAMILDRLATDNTGYLPPFLQSSDVAALKAAARAYREAHPDCRHPRVALLADGSAAVAVWTKKHPVTERGEVEIIR